MDMTDQNLIEERGYWWLPDNPDVKLPGTLAISSKGECDLKLLGSFTKIEDLGKSTIQPVIHGVGEKNGQYTLMDCSGRSETIRISIQGGSNINSEEYLIGTVYSGCFFPKPHDVKFPKVEIKIESFEDWLNIIGFRTQYEVDPETKRPHNFSISLQEPKTFSFSLPRFTLQIVSYYRIDPSPKVKHIQSSVTWSVRINYSEDQTLDQVYADIVILRHLIALGMRRPIKILSVVLTSPRFMQKIGEHESLIPIHYYSRLISAEESEQETIHPPDMFFSFDDVQNHFSDILTRWFELYDQIEPVLSLYFSTIYNGRTASSVSFLQIAQALETFHRRIEGGQFLSDAERDEVKAALIDAIPAHFSCEEKEALEGKLTFIHEFSLRPRLRSQINAVETEYGTEVSKYIRDKKKFVANVTDTRNYLTHYDESLKSKAKQGKGLLLLKERCQFLLEMLILKELGFSLDMVSSILLKTSVYQFILQYRELNPESAEEEW
ncbi:HEPN domain-containing protein [Methanosphaerula subterraneus]|uniref:ApeA N-terminal domain 1-containing protein n=1 Tax=Methanosphaerula subterraneus TaxID=3350244 RepID=UPI003F85848A